MTGEELFGRQKELEILDKVWDSESTHVISLVAWGGVGKSTLVNKWLERMKAENFRGAKQVFAWTFHSQGSGEKVTSADMFFSEALSWFGDPDPVKGSPWDKGERLADLIRKKKTPCSCWTDLNRSSRHMSTSRENQRSWHSNPPLGACQRQ